MKFTLWTCWCKISAIGTATVLGSSLSHLTPDIQVYVDVDDMKHLASGHGQKHRVDEIILPQKAYKGGGSENWTDIWTPLIQNSINHIKVTKTFWAIITYPVCPGQYGEYGGYDFLLIKVCLLYGKCSSSLWPKLITMKVIVILTTTIMKMTKLSEGGGNDVCQIGCLSSFGLVSALRPLYRRLRKVNQYHV